MSTPSTRWPGWPMLAAVCGAGALAVAGCGTGPPVPGANGTINPDSTLTVGSYSVMAEWDGCTALDDIQSIEEFMGVTDWGDSGLASHDIPGGMDGEAFNCGAFLAQLPAYEQKSEVTGDRTWGGHANIDVGVAPWNSDQEATENFQVRVEQLDLALETGGTEYARVVNGEFSGSAAAAWDETYVHAGSSTTGYVLSAIARKGDVVMYVFLDHTNDPAIGFGEPPVYPFTDDTLLSWVLDEYMPEAYTGVMALKAEGTEAGIVSG